MLGHLEVNALHRKQLFVCAALDNATFVHDDNLIAVGHRTDAMTDEHDRS